MEYLEQMQRGIDHIEAHLDEAISLAEVARVGGMSRWHYQRIFHALTGETLKTYIRSRRMAGALDRLLATEMRILDIALLAGFESQEAFARAFKHAFDMSPSEYRKLGNKSLFLRKAQMDDAYLRHIHQNISLTPTLDQRAPMTLVGLATHGFGVDSEKNNIGDKLPPLWTAFIPRIGEIKHRIPGVCYGVIQQESRDDERLCYYAAIEVTQADPLPDGMARVDVPGSTYATFLHRGATKTIDHTVNYAYSTWLTKSRMRHTEQPDLEIYGAEYDPTSDASVVYYAIPVEAAVPPSPAQPQSP